MAVQATRERRRSTLVVFEDCALNGSGRLNREPAGKCSVKACLSETRYEKGLRTDVAKAAVRGTIIIMRELSSWELGDKVRLR